MATRLVAFLLALFACATRADERIEVRYRLGEAESSVSARSGAMAKLRLAALPHAGQRVRGHLRLHDDHLVERIDHLAEAAITMQDLVEIWESDGPDRYLRLSASVSVDQAALDRFHASASTTPGVTRVPLDEHLLAASARERERKEREEALLGPWLIGVLEPLAATPVDLEVIDIPPASGRHAKARVRLRWAVPQATLVLLCRRLLCSPQVQGRVTLRGPRPPAEAVPPVSAADQARIAEWLQRSDVFVTVHLGKRFLADAPMLETPPDAPRLSPAKLTQFQLGGLIKTLHAEVDTEIEVLLPVSSLTADQMLHATVKIHSERR